MRTLIELESVAFDTQPVSSDATVQFFVEAGRRGVIASAAEIPEPALVRWLFLQHAARGLLFRKLLLQQQAHCQVQVRYPFLEKSMTPPGDIDLLASDPDQPHLAVAIEWKRVKVRATNDGQEVVNKIEALGDAVSQVRGLKRLGFDRTYLAVVAAVDGRGVSAGNFVARGTSDRTFCRTIEVASGLDIPPQVGLLYVEISQPLQKTIDEAAVISVAVIKPAKRCGQSDRTTARVEQYLAAQHLAA
jgi:hypothetical protein